MVQSRSLAALAVVFTLAACGESGSLGPVTQSFDTELAAALASASDPGSSERGGGGSGLFDRLAAEIPGFGGLYRTGPCVVSVVLTDMSQATHAVHVVQVALAPLNGRGCPGGVRVHPVEGQFTYIDLQRYLAAARPLLDIRGVNGVLVSYSLNRLVIVVSAHAVVPRVLEALARIGIPEAAVAFQGGGGRG